MTGMQNIAKGFANKFVGQAKQVAAQVIGSRDLYIAGRAQVIQGDAQRSIGHATNAVRSIMRRPLA